jgi:hypothetical protein
MRPLSLRTKRVLLATWLVALLFVLGNHWLEWGLFGQADRFAVSAMTALTVLFLMSRFGSRMMDEGKAEQDAIRREEEAAELARDKSNDAADTERLQHLIGMPSDASQERKREE